MPFSAMTLHFSLSQVVFLGVAAFVFQRNSALGKTLIALSIFVLAYLVRVGIDIEIYPNTAYILGRLSYGVPAAIWLMAFILFRSEKKVPLYAWFIIALYSLLRAIGVAYLPLSFDAPLAAGGVTPAHILFYIVPQLLNIGMYIHTLALASLEYNRDLVESRRRLRIYFVGVLGSFWLLVSLQVMVSVLMRMGWNSDLSHALYHFINNTMNILLFPALLAVNLMFFRMYLSGIASANKGANSHFPHQLDDKVIDPADLKLKDLVLRSMTEDKAYRQAGLTISALAKQIGTQEFKLRKVINQVLQFNNFSCFLNVYRIKDAEERLIASEDPINNVGLDVGYNSLSSFHKAFKEKHGVTPKEFRILHRNTLVQTHDDHEAALAL